MIRSSSATRRAPPWQPCMRRGTRRPGSSWSKAPSSSPRSRRCSDRLEPVLRGPGFGAAWSRISEYAFRLDEVARGCPVIRRGDEPATTGRRPRLLAGPLRANARRAAGLAGRGSGQDAADRPAGHVGRRARSSADEAAWLEANLPDARTLVWPGSGHFPHLAHPRAFAELLAPMGLLADLPVASISR